MPTPVIGDIIGFGETTGGFTVDVTLTDTVPKSDTSDQRGLLVVVATLDDRATAFSETHWNSSAMVVTDDGGTASSPYACRSNYVLSGSDMLWTDGGYGVFLTASRGAAYWDHAAVLRGAISYIVVNDLGVDNVVTVDLSNIGISEPIWIGVNLHAISNPSGYLSAYAAIGGGYLEGAGFNINSTFGHDEYGLGMAAAITPFTGQTFFASLHNSPTDPLDAEYELSQSSSPEFKAFYGFYDYLGTPYGGDVGAGATPPAYANEGSPGFPVSGETAAGPDWGVGINMTWTHGGSVGEDPCLSWRPHIYRRSG